MSGHVIGFPRKTRSFFTWPGSIWPSEGPKLGGSDGQIPSVCGHLIGFLRPPYLRLFAARDVQRLLTYIEKRDSGIHSYLEKSDGDAQRDGWHPSAEFLPPLHRRAWLRAAAGLSGRLPGPLAHAALLLPRLLPGLTDRADRGQRSDGGVPRAGLRRVGD